MRNVNRNRQVKVKQIGSTVVEPMHTRPKVKKIPIALRFDPKLLSEIDGMATRRGISRNAIISYWCSKGVESEE